MAGLQSNPTPAWQLPAQGLNAPKLQGAAPPGYTFDPVQMRYVPTVGSAQTALADKTRLQGQQDQAFGADMAERSALAGQEQDFYNQSRQGNAVRDQQQSQDFDQRTALRNKLSGALDGLTGMFSSASGAFGANGPSPMVMTSPIAPPINLQPNRSVDYNGGDNGMSMVNAATSAAQNAAFGKAKAQAGALGRSAIDSTAAELASRGLGTGGGAFARSVAGRVAQATNPLSDINAAQLGENATNARHNQDIQAAAASTAYQGGIAQRGQDIQQQESANGLQTGIANANAERSLQANTTNAQLEQQRALARQSMLHGSISAAVQALGRLY